MRHSNTEINHHPALKEGEKPMTTVHLADGTAVKIDTEDWWRLIEDGFAGRWFMNGKAGQHQYVRMRCSRNRGKNNATVARLIMRAQPGTVVAYNNGKTTDLRRRNLRIERRDGSVSKLRSRARQQRSLSATLMIS